MRIFLSCQQDLGGPPHPVPAYRFWRGYFAHALAEAGHELLEAPECDWAAGLLPLADDERTAWREKTWTTALDWIRREHARQPIDLFLAYLYPQQVEPAELAELRSLDIPTVNFFCDNVREFRRVPPEYRNFDLHWVPETAALPLYQRANLPAIHAPMPCWVPPAFRAPPTEEKLSVSFIGTRDELRAGLFADAISRGLDITLYGPGWREPAPGSNSTPISAHGLLSRQLAFVRQHGAAAFFRKVTSKFQPTQSVNFDFAPHAGSSLTAQDYLTSSRDATVCIGVNRYPSPRHSLRHPGTYSRLRDIEAPMLGACYLTEWAEGLDALYEGGVEIETYRDAAELVEKARALQADPSRRARLRTAGQRRALSDHSIARTLERIATRLGLKP